MTDIKRIPDDSRVICVSGAGDAEIRFEQKENRTDIYLRAVKSLPEFIILRWNYRFDSCVRVMSDAWERSYADLSWKSLDARRFMPWYFLVSDGRGKTTGCGVKTGCSSFVSFCCDGSGITAYIDVRSGSHGVNLNGRELLAASLVCEEYEGISEFAAARRFCRVMCDKPLSPAFPVYGGNNWYYAYGKSSFNDIIEDTKLQVRLAGDNENRPFMVIDDGWEINGCKGPWEPNDKFGNMTELAAGIKSLGAKPGIWVRFLSDENKEIPDEWRNKGSKEYLDPSVPGTLEYIAETIEKIRSWGYGLLKHDFATYDIFGLWGKEMNGTITGEKNVVFADGGRTSAEIVLDFYKTVRKAAGDMTVIGCNTVSHLCAGLVEINRTGDDTSGEIWERTKLYGVNTLGFRLAQNGAFYASDADCVGIIPGRIPWEMNSQWLDLLSRSGTPLFVSCAEGSLAESQEKEISEAYKRAAVQKNVAEPLDWVYNDLPQRWLIDGETRNYDWTGNIYAMLR